MGYALICSTAFVISFLALFSGFGVGTVLMPVFAIFFPLQIAIASTAVIHLINNLFKALLIGRLAKWKVVIQFGIPAAFASALGAYLLSWALNLPLITTYHIQNYEFKMTPIGLTVGVIIILSSFFELIPKFRQSSFPPKYIPLGGAISGFFGGISGNQGMFRAAFLIKSGLNKNQFIGTSAMCSIVVDVVRILVYGWAIYSKQFSFTLSHDMQGILIAATFSSIVGSYLGAAFMDKITFKIIQILIGIMLLVLGLAIGLGIVIT